MKPDTQNPRETPAAPKKQSRRRPSRGKIVLLALGALLGGAGATFLLWPTSVPDVMQGRDFNCWKVGKCSEDCALRCPDDLKKYNCMLGCTERCQAKGCESARAVNKTLTDCVKRRCLLKCLGGPGPKCNGCTRDKCKAESQACHKHRC